MSAEASKAATEAKSSGTKKKAAAEEIKAAAAPAEAPGPQVESQHDRFETLLEYEPNAKLPAAVVLVWACALIGLGTYAVTFYFPDLSLWHP